MQNILGVPGFYIGSLSIAWYGVIIAFSMLVAFGMGMYLAKGKKYNLDTGYHLLLIIIPSALIGARILFMIMNGVPIGDFFRFRDGGISLMGGIFMAILGLLVYTRVRKVGFFTLCDFIVVGLILAQGIGRWANIVNSELLGWEVSGGAFPFVTQSNGRYFLTPTFYESITNLVGFAFLFWFFTKKQTKWGQTSALYFIWYGVTRAIWEPLRHSPDLLVNNGNYIVFNQVNFLISLLLIAFGCAILYLNRKGLISQENAVLLKKEATSEPETERHSE